MPRFNGPPARVLCEVFKGWACVCLATNSTAAIRSVRCLRWCQFAVRGSQTLRLRVTSRCDPRAAGAAIGMQRTGSRQLRGALQSLRGPRHLQSRFAQHRRGHYSLPEVRLRMGGAAVPGRANWPFAAAGLPGPPLHRRRRLHDRLRRRCAYLGGAPWVRRDARYLSSHLTLSLPRNFRYLSRCFLPNSSSNSPTPLSPADARDGNLS
jgi:hypothetical protein